MTITLPDVKTRDIEVQAADLDPARAAKLYREYGCFVVRGLSRQFAGTIRDDIYALMNEAIAMIDRAQKIEEGWITPDGTLFIQAPPGFIRDKQVMVTSCRYTTSAAFLASALDPRLLDVAEAVLGPDVELFTNGQCLCKEPVGGHPKMLHQDASYDEHKYDGPLAVLNYAVDTDLKRGCLHVVPGSHRLGLLDHVDTESHLGLPLDAWPWESSLPIEGEAGDAIFFHSKTIHGSKPNHTDSPRPVFIHRYRAARDYVVAVAATTTRRQEAQKHKEEASKGNQQGFMVRGRRTFIDDDPR